MPCRSTTSAPTFHPVLWNERHEETVVPDVAGIRHTKDERITQVWFSGVHSNVGRWLSRRFISPDTACMDHDGGHDMWAKV